MNDFEKIKYEELQQGCALSVIITLVLGLILLTL